MQFAALPLLLLLVVAGTQAFTAVSRSPASRFGTTSATLSMVLEKPTARKVAKIEVLKIESDHLIHPLKEVRGVRFDWICCVCVCACVMIYN